ncbi:MAG: hypothetical protein JEZ08_24030 [Clostridiales bacterium]|nr:hypothetical protein [Clostridiales bacterium]
MKVKILILILLTCVLIGCQNKTIYIEPLELELESVTDQDVINLMVDHLESLGHKGDIKSSVKVSEIKNDLPKLCYLVSLDYANSKQIVITENNQVISSLPGGYIEKAYVLDSNGDEEKELLFQTDIGSGLRIILVSHYDFSTGVVRTGQFYNNNDGLIFEVVNNKICAFNYYFEFDRKSEDPIGELLFKENLEIENLDTF